MPQKPSKLLPALYGGLIMGAISGVPGLNLLNCLCCAGVMFGGLMSVFFYKKDLTQDAPPLTSSDSLQLGALAGLFGALIGTLIHGLTLATVGDVMGGVVLHTLQGLRDTLPPEAMDQIENSLSQSAGLGMLSLITTFFFSLILDPLFGLLGGLIGYSLYRPKPGMTNVQPPMNPPAQT